MTDTECSFTSTTDAATEPPSTPTTTTSATLPRQLSLPLLRPPLPHCKLRIGNFVTTTLG